MTKGIEYIGMFTFSHCTSLKNLDIPNGVKDIVESAFVGAGIKTITIPNSVTYIGWKAFGEMPSDAHFIVGSETLKTLILNSESGITEAQITVDTSIN